MHIKRLFVFILCLNILDSLLSLRIWRSTLLLLLNHILSAFNYVVQIPGNLLFFDQVHCLGNFDFFHSKLHLARTVFELAFIHYATPFVGRCLQDRLLTALFVRVIELRVLNYLRINLTFPDVPTHPARLCVIHQDWNRSRLLHGHVKLILNCGQSSVIYKILIGCFGTLFFHEIVLFLLLNREKSSVLASRIQGLESTLLVARASEPSLP